MAILEIGESAIVSIPRTSLVAEGLRERRDLQRLLLESIDTIAPDVMVIAEEVSDWQDSKRRIDILGIDKEANLVVIELKRTEDGGHMELQALRYAAMAAVFTFEKVVDFHRQHLENKNDESDPRDAILEFLDLEDPDEGQFAQDVRIVLVSVEFSTEITTTVLWLIGKGVDIRCVRLTPYKVANRLLVDVQQIIPLPEAADYITKAREKAHRRRRARDLTTFDIRLGEEELTSLRKRHAILAVVRYLSNQGIPPDDIVAAIQFRKPETVLVSFEGEVDERFIRDELTKRNGSGKRGRYHPRRWFHRQDEIIHQGGTTYVISNQWGRYTEKALRNMAAAFPAHGIRIAKSRPAAE